MALSLTPKLLPLALEWVLVCTCFVGINNHSMREYRSFPIIQLACNNGHNNSELCLNNYFIYRVPSHLFPHFSLYSVTKGNKEENFKTGSKI